MAAVPIPTNASIAKAIPGRVAGRPAAALDVTQPAPVAAQAQQVDPTPGVQYHVQAPPPVPRPYDLNVPADGQNNMTLPLGRDPSFGGQKGPAKPAPSPLDSTYYQNVAANQFKINNQLNALNQAQGYAGTDLQAALAKLAYQQPRDALKLEQGANRQGSLFSSVYGQNLGNLQYQYLGREGGLQDTFQRQSAARANQMQGLRGSIPIYDEGQYLAAVLRASQAAQKNPATGQSKAPLTKGKGKGGAASRIAEKMMNVRPTKAYPGGYANLPLGRDVLR